MKYSIFHYQVTTELDSCNSRIRLGNSCVPHLKLIYPRTFPIDLAVNLSHGWPRLDFGLVALSWLLRWGSGSGSGGCLVGLCGAPLVPRLLLWDGFALIKFILTVCATCGRMDRWKLGVKVASGMQQRQWSGLESSGRSLPLRFLPSIA